ncbi:MAG: iron chelate uptake ABC transporter family permease subunit [Oscillospiraceae bacterium]|nr:iron chelate uptake ABC transporter family permease subunit [Oscillospiraceae bacterium]
MSRVVVSNMSSVRKIVALSVIALACAALYMTVSVNPKYAAFAVKLRAPRLTAMLVTAFAIGGATIVFQTIINNNIVTPCLLGMNSLYTMTHTLIAFFLNTASAAFTNRNLAFAIDLIVMSAASTLIYGWLFKKTKYNVLYVLLVGTVLANFFGSVQSTLTRVMDPNEYDALLSTLVASFSKVNADVIALSLVLMAAVLFLLRRDLALLNVITLGKDRAINLGVDYDRTIRRLLLGVTIFITIATALVGPISFLGLIIANLSRQLFRTYRHSFLIAGSALFGMAALVGGQLIVERVFVYSVPVSVFVTVGGGVYFLYMLTRGKAV